MIDSEEFSPAEYDDTIRIVLDSGILEPSGCADMARDFIHLSKLVTKPFINRRQNAARLKALTKK